MIALVLMIWVCAAGALLARRLDVSTHRLSETLALGAPIGLAVFASLGFMLGWAVGLSPASVVGAALLTMVIGFGLRAKGAAVLSLGRPWPNLGVLVLSILSVALVVRLADRTLFETGTGIATGDRHNFGDLPFHMAISAGFAYGDNFPPDHPELAGVPLTYPFFGDLIAAMILSVGGSWRDAFFWPSLILGLSVVVALVRFGEVITGSRALGRMAAGLTVFSGGLGFLDLTSVEAAARWWTTGPDLTIHDSGIRYANFVTTLFIPQRSILFGWPLLFFALALLIEGLRKQPGSDAQPSRFQLWLRAGVLTSFLPLVHAHSFAVMGFCVLVYAAMADFKSVMGFARGVVPLAVPAILFMLTHNSLSTGRFLEWQPGFDGGGADPLKYWVKNAGLFLPLAAIGIMRAAPPSARALVAAPFVALFVLANLFRLSPWMWDNMKFLAPAHAGLAPFAALAIAASWKAGRAGKAAAVLAFILAIASGALDVSKVAFAGGEFGIFNQRDLAFAEKVREATPPSTTILTAPTHNHPVLLSGRRVFLGYEGHLWSQGLDHEARKPLAEALFRGDLQTGNAPGSGRVGAIAITPAERDLIADPLVFEGFPSLVDSPYRLLGVR